MTESDEKRQGFIYQIINMKNEMKYIGSTFQRLSKRFHQHRRASKNKKDHKKLNIAFREYGVEHFRIELLDTVSVQSKQELNRIEGEWIRKENTYENGYNMQIAGRTKKEYVKEHYEADREKRKIRDAKYRKKHKEKIKKNQEDNKEKYEVGRKIYKEKNKEIILENKKEIINCECGIATTRNNLARHKKSKSHLKYYIVIL